MADLVRARVELRGCMSHTARGRTFKKGQTQVLTNAGDVAFYQGLPDFRVEILAAPKKKAKAPAPDADTGDGEGAGDEGSGDADTGGDAGGSDEGGGEESTGSSKKKKTKKKASRG